MRREKKKKKKSCPPACHQPARPPAKNPSSTFCPSLSTSHFASYFFSPSYPIRLCTSSTQSLHSVFDSPIPPSCSSTTYVLRTPRRLLQLSLAAARTTPAAAANLCYPSCTPPFSKPRNWSPCLLCRQRRKFATKNTRNIRTREGANMDPPRISSPVTRSSPTRTTSSSSAMSSTRLTAP